ncbi:hypothetical protein OA07_02575 [Aphanizomenon flos-aquae 2012/KM1/D3]|nr:hypothetical protein OA07_02575 [Aphanizomenon flos-aquae 2012/KM1/D3]
MKAEPSRIHSHTEYGNEKTRKAEPLLLLKAELLEFIPIQSMETRNEKRVWEGENEKRENLPNI